MEKLKYPQDYDDGGFIILDDLNEIELNKPRVQVMFKRSSYNSLCLFIISQDYYELPKRTICANRNIYRIFKANNLEDVQNLYQDEASMDMTVIEFKHLASTC